MCLFLAQNALINFKTDGQLETYRHQLTLLKIILNGVQVHYPVKVSRTKATSLGFVVKLATGNHAFIFRECQ